MERLTTLWAALLMGVLAYALAGLGAALLNDVEALFEVGLQGHLFFLGFSLAPFLFILVTIRTFSGTDTKRAGSLAQATLFPASLLAQYYLFCRLAEHAQVAIGFVVIPFYLTAISMVVFLVARLTLFLSARYRKSQAAGQD